MKGRVLVTLCMTWIFATMLIVSAYAEDDYPLYIKDLSTLNLLFFSACVDGNNLFVYSGSGIHVIDISSPGDPHEISSWNCELANGIAVSGNIMCMSRDTNVSIWDISDITSPTLLSNIALTGSYCEDLKFYDNYLLAPNGYFIDVIDISDPHNPVLASSIDTPGVPNQIEIRGHLALVADINCFTLLDITDPVYARIMSVIRDPMDCWSVAWCGDYAVYSSYGNDPNVDIVDISDPYNARIISGVYVSGFTVYVTGSEKFAYVSIFNGNIAAIDMSNPWLPRVVAYGGVANGGRIKSKNDILLYNNPYTMKIATLSPPCTGIAGDANGDSHFNGLDIVYDVNFLKGIGYPVCPTYCSDYISPVYREADANGNCQFNGIDITYGINFLKGGPPLPEICPDCPE